LKGKSYSVSSDNRSNFSKNKKPVSASKRSHQTEPVQPQKAKTMEHTKRDWPFIKSTSIRPFIVTCDKRMETFREFVKSYNANAKHSLLPAIVYYDGESEEYHQLIDSMEPCSKIKQKHYPSSEYGDYSETIDYKAICVFPKIIENRNERILFLEDDVLFSSQFSKAIKEVERQFNSYHVVDIVTMYGSGDCYWPAENNKASHPIYGFSGKDYYGNLAVIFDTNVLKWWRANIHNLWINDYSGWDIKIGHVLQEAGFNFYCTDRHYVQHQVGYSVIAESHKNQQSSLFIE